MQMCLFEADQISNEIVSLAELNEYSLLSAKGFGPPSFTLLLRDELLQLFIVVVKE